MRPGIPKTLQDLIQQYKEQGAQRELQKQGIKRYKIVDGVLVEHPDGDLVKFLDHAIETGELRLQNTRSYNEGRQEGPEYSWRL